MLDCRQEIMEFLHKHLNKELLRFITCGSVDDGKSTMIGRLLFDTNLVFEDQLMALKSEAKYKRTEDEIDFSLLIDGLQAEREQGITIDVAYRYFTTEKRKFIVADTPGHEQYTRNMATGASNADLAVILIDARNGVLTQTKRHTFIITLLGIRSIIVAVNKMDLVDYSEEVFEKIKEDYKELIMEIHNKFPQFHDDSGDLRKRERGIFFLDNLFFVPISALKGDNVVHRSRNMSWYSGKTLLEYLEEVKVNNTNYDNKPFRFPVQYVNRPNQDFRGYCGMIVSGEVSEGDEIVVLPSKVKTRVRKIIPPVCRKEINDKPSLDSIATVSRSVAPMMVTLLTEDEVDIARGDVIVKGDALPDMSDSFDIFVVWMHEEPLKLNKIYDLKRATTKLTGYVEDIYYKINVNTLERQKSKEVHMNEIAYCKLTLSRSIPFDKYWNNRYIGGLIFIDRITNNTAGVGLISAKSKSKHILCYEHKLRKVDRERLKGHKPCVVWLTGLSGSGKSTIANELEVTLNRMGVHTYLLDGDNVRHGLNRDLGFSKEDRVENIRRIAEVCRLFVDAGLVVITAFISPFKEGRDYARSLVKDNEFVEVFVDAPIDVCKRRDPKGLYQKAERGEIKDFTGIDSPYESPEAPEVHVKTHELTVEEAVGKVLRYLEKIIF